MATSRQPHHLLGSCLMQGLPLLLPLLQREAQKTKWVIDLVMKVDEQYKQDVAAQQQQIVSGQDDRLPSTAEDLAGHNRLTQWARPPCLSCLLIEKVAP